MMRITTGSARGTRLKLVPGENTRPTSDRLKQAVFSAIQFEIEGRSVLDLFAGTGQLGLEALSRGAARCTFVDNENEAIAALRENIEKTHLGELSRVVKSDYKAFLQSAPKRSFDIIFVDPPYRPGFIKRILNFIDSFDIAAQNGIILCETAAEEQLPEIVGGLSFEKRYEKASSAVTVYRNGVKSDENGAHPGEL